MTRQMSREQAVRLAATGLVHSVLEASVVLLFAWSMSLEAFRPVLFFVLAVGISLGFWIAVRQGWSERLRDPSLLLPSHLADWALQLAFILLLPSLTVIFMLALLVRYNQAMIHFDRRQFAVSWVILAVTLTAVFFQGRHTFSQPGVDTMGIFLLWVFFVLCLLRLTATGRAFSGLREELLRRNEMLGASAARLLEVSDRERLQERERVARDLHENLIQELQGLVMNFQAAAERLPQGVPARQEMQSALEQAERVLADSHERVLDLQSCNVGAAGLTKALVDVACELSRDHSATYDIRARSLPIPLQDPVADEGFRIAREALVNAFQHADATRVDVELCFHPDRFELQVIDNGKGMSADLVTHGSPGHWGLGIMRDRARKLGGRLSIRPGEVDGGGGTVVTLTVPAALAYRPAAEAATGRAGRLRRWIARRFGTSRDQ